MVKLFLSRFLMYLPASLTLTTFIPAIPALIWAIGYTFQQWSPLLDAQIDIPSHKVLIRLVGIPMALWMEQAVIRAVSTFGVYLGIISPEDPTSCASWTVAAATYDLESIPKIIEMKAGGLRYPVSVNPFKWKETPLYDPSEMPTQPQQFTPLRLSTPDASSSKEVGLAANDDLIVISRRILDEICKGRELHTLSENVQDFFNQLGCPMGSINAGESPKENLTALIDSPTPQAATENQLMLMQIQGPADQTAEEHHEAGRMLEKEGQTIL